MVEDDLGYIWFFHILSKNYGCFLKNSKNITLVDVVRSLHSHQHSSCSRLPIYKYKKIVEMYVEYILSAKIFLIKSCDSSFG